MAITDSSVQVKNAAGANVTFNVKSIDGELSAVKLNANAAGVIINPATSELQSTGNASLATLATAIKIEDAPHASGDAGIMPLAVVKVAQAGLAFTDGDYSPLQVDSGGALRVIDTAILSNAATLTARLASSAATTNAANVKTSSAKIFAAQGINKAIYDIFLVLYDSAANPPVPGTTTIRKKIAIPAGAAFALDWPSALTFSNGIGYAFVRNPADADATAIAAGDILAFNLDYT
jgi:hypothetical protein